MIDKDKKLILLIDDDKFLVDMYSMKFVQQGFNVQTCLSVGDALELLRGGLLPDAVVFDITMPEHDGFSLLKSLAEEHLAEKAVKIALTNQSSDEEKTKAKEMGAADYIVKASMIPSEVVNMVEKIIDNKKKSY